MSTLMDQYWHKGGLTGIISRATLRTLQFIFAMAIIGIYAPDLTSSTSSRTRANSEWIFAEVAACLSALTCITHCFVTVTRVAWCLWDLVLCVLWMAQVGVFAGIFLKDGIEEQYVGATGSVSRMKAGVWVGLVNMVLWLITFLLGLAWCCCARRMRRKGKAVRAGMLDEADDRTKMVKRDVEKEASDLSPAGQAESRADVQRKKAKMDEALGLERVGSESKPPSYRSV